MKLTYIVDAFLWGLLVSQPLLFIVFEGGAWLQKREDERMRKICEDLFGITPSGRFALKEREG